MAHLGAIRGLVHAISVGATAFGPIALAVVQEFTGSYTPALLGLAVIPAAIAVAALLIRTPTPWTGPGADQRQSEHDRAQAS